jgi:hypothetical protein
VREIVALEAGGLVRSQLLAVLRVELVLLEGARAAVAVQALPVLERLVELDLRRDVPM